MKIQNLWMGLVAVSLLALSNIGSANQIALDVAMGSPYVLADSKTVAYVRIDMTGFELEDSQERTPVNLAIVLDKSGSMNGDKITQAKKAARNAINRLVTPVMRPFQPRGQKRRCVLSVGPPKRPSPATT